MCGPSCTVDPNMDGSTRPHVHPVAKATTPEGFPLHRLPSNIWDLPKTLPRALNAFERRFEVKRQDGQSSATPNQPMLNDPSLRMHSSGKIRTMDHAWRIGRFRGLVNKNEYGLDHPHAIEMDELPRVEPGAYLPKDSRVISNGANGLPVEDWRSYSRNKGKMPAAGIEPTTPVASLHSAVADGARAASIQRSARFTSNESVHTVIRHPAAHAPHLHSVQADGADVLTAKGSDHVSHPGMQQAGRTPDTFDARFPRRHSRPSESSPLARSCQSAGVSRYTASTIVSSCESRPLNPALYRTPPSPSGSPSTASCRHRARTSGGSSERRPFSRRGTDVSSLRRAASVRAASIRLQAFISAFAPGRRLVVANPDPDEEEDANDEETEAEVERTEEVEDEDYTLRHQQRMAQNDVKERLQLIDKNCKRFKAISYTEPINAQVFVDVDHLLKVKATIDENNRQHGGSQDEEASWDGFLNLLESAECVIEDEITRILANIEAEYGEKMGKAGQEGEQQRQEQQGKDLRSDTPQDAVQSTGGSISTTMATMTMDSVPPLRMGLVRSLSI